MQFRSIKMLVSLVALTLLGSCTSRYQDLLRDRDAEIRNLNGSLASMRAQKDGVFWSGPVRKPSCFATQLTSLCCASRTGPS